MNTRPRSKEEFSRIYGSWDRLAWGYGLACIVEGCETRDRRPSHGGHLALHTIECAHTRNGGTGRKADAEFTVFACWRHHDEMGRGVKTFTAKYAGRLSVNGVPVADLHHGAEETQRQWLAGEALCG